MSVLKYLSASEGKERGRQRVELENLEEKKMILLRKALATSIAVVFLTAGASLIQAQQQTYRGTFRSVSQLIHRIENRTNLFRDNLSPQTQRVINGERNLEGLANDLQLAVSQLRERFDNRQATTTDVEEVLSRAARLDRIVRRTSNSGVTQRNWSSLRADLNQLASVFNLSWPTVGGNFPGNPTYPGQTNLLTGTYRLDSSRSDDPVAAADRAVQNLRYNQRSRLRDQIIARLESPDQLAIERRGRDVTIASSRAPQISFTADGVERVETGPNGRTIRARATLSGDQLIVSSTGDRATEFNVTFNPIDYGNRLSVTRRVYVQGLSAPVVVQSTYDKTSAVARFDINTGPVGYPGSNTSSDAYLVRDGETMIGVLNNRLSTETTREGERFTMTVRQPLQFEGATIEGHVSSVQRSGRLTGRSQMTLNFDNIRLRDGKTYRFAGLVESVRTNQGDTVRVDNEGAVRESSQTTRTAQRAAIGTAVGAIIGAIAGGGKGAAIGAIVGAGGGAGSIYVQGRDDLDLEQGSELTIRASSPR